MREPSLSPGFPYCLRPGSWIQGPFPPTPTPMVNPSSPCALLNSPAFWLRRFLCPIEQTTGWLQADCWSSFWQNTEYYHLPQSVKWSFNPSALINRLGGVSECTGPILFCFICLLKKRKQKNREAVTCLSHVLSHLAKRSRAPRCSDNTICACIVCSLLAHSFWKSLSEFLAAVSSWKRSFLLFMKCRSWIGVNQRYEINIFRGSCCLALNAFAS